MLQKSRLTNHKSVSLDISSYSLQKHENTDSRAWLLKGFINTVFEKNYGAHVGSLYPRLLAIYRQNQSLAAVAGMRSAEHEALFLESYLKTTGYNSIESLLSSVFSRAVERYEVVEIGNLAPAKVGQARWLITTLTAYLAGVGYRYVTFTGVPALVNAFKRLKIELIELTEATSEALPADEQNQWGSYYELNPKVYVGDVARGYECLKPYIDANSLYQEAFALGQYYRDNRQIYIDKE